MNIISKKLEQILNSVRTPVFRGKCNNTCICFEMHEGKDKMNYGKPR